MRSLFPIDVSKAQFELAEAPRPVLDFKTKEREVNENGEAMFSVRVLARSETEMAVIGMKVPGVLPGLAMGDLVTVTGLVLKPWIDKTGKLVLTFTADRVVSAAKAVSKVA